MAILKLGELVVGIRGTVGGVIFSANKAGPFARAWSRGSNPRTTPQTTQRAIMSSHPAEWQDLTQGQRDDWDTYAADPAQDLTNSLGQTYSASGYNWYCRINNHLFSADEPRRDTFPTNARPAAPDIDELDVETPISLDSDVRVLTPYDEFLGFFCVVYITFAPSPALLWKSRGYRLIYVDKSDYHTVENLGFELQDVFGDPILDSKAFAYIRRQEPHGQRSSPTSVTDIVRART